MSRMLKALQQIEENVTVTPTDAANASASADKQVTRLSRLLDKIQQKHDPHRPASASTDATRATGSGLAMAQCDSGWRDLFPGEVARSTASASEQVVAGIETQAETRAAMNELTQVSDYVCSDVVPEAAQAAAETPAEPVPEIPLDYRQLAAGMVCHWQLPTVVGVVPVGAAHTAPWVIVPLSAAIAAVLNDRVLLVPADQMPGEGVAVPADQPDEAFDNPTPYPLVRLLNQRRTARLISSPTEAVAEWREVCRQKFAATVVLLPEAIGTKALRLIARCDALYLAVRLGQVTAQAVFQATKQLDSFGVPVRGCIALNKLEKPAK